MIKMKLSKRILYQREIYSTSGVELISSFQVKILSARAYKLTDENLICILLNESFLKKNLPLTSMACPDLHSLVISKK